MITPAVVTVSLVAVAAILAGWRCCLHVHRAEDRTVRTLAAMQAAQQIAAITLSARERMHRVIADARRSDSN